MLEAYFLTGIVIPGTLIVDAGGILVQRGLLDFLDLVWFVAVGSILGSEMSYWTGRLAKDRLPGRRRIENSAAFARATRLFARHGGVALVIGRFLGPVAGLVPLAAALAGMERRRFLIWNIIGSVPYAFVHVAIGYALGGALGQIGGSVTRVAVLIGAILLLLAVLWGLLYSLLRLLPLAGMVLAAALRGIAEIPLMAKALKRHPETVHRVVARFDRSTFTGLPLTFLSLLIIYIGVVWIDTAMDFALDASMAALDMRLAELIHQFWSPAPIRIASWITIPGGVRVVAPLVAATLIWLVLAGQRPLATGLTVSVMGNTLTVSLLKHAFGRSRSPLGYFVETSGSFPSGHAAVSVAAYGMLTYVLWRTRVLRAESALLLAGLVAFAIGVSRIYLIEHYLSDVLNGWLVGALWLTIGIAVAEWLSSRSFAYRPVRGRTRIAGQMAMIAIAGFATVGLWRHEPARNAPAHIADVTVSGPLALSGPDLPVMTESLIGTPVDAISLVVFTRDERTLSNDMEASGWTPAPPPSPGRILDAISAAIIGNEDPTVQMVTHFWRGMPGDLTFSAPSGGTATLSVRHPHARFWRTEYVTPDGFRAWVGAVGLDDDADRAPDQEISADQGLNDSLVQALIGQGATARGRISLPLEGSSGPASMAADITVLVIGH
ncbi:membrane protein DedA with SNARE-associated domain [Gemmobacter caeni]|uniref:Membrane protein DedA with SNARE-associated domain n=2 Tax=Gemmobacter caeni TaxID=589035 RepID=A0A2T6AYL5_9RHOB|nr:membrane protein DedA with SNARE-associated domain [Gemmobacter caeni]TWI99098.1 membrane protein DedA with SNARE-associated domain [Gemmobacter caeni]